MRRPDLSTDDRPTFLLDQPFWAAKAKQAAERWDLAVREEEPEIEGLASAHRPAPDESGSAANAKWVRITREDLLAYAVSEDPDYRRVGIVCGAGLGKTTNLEYLEAAINDVKGGKGKQFAYMIELADLPSDRDALLVAMIKKIKNRIEASDGKIRHALLRLLAAGRVTFLLDSLDQANPDPRGPAVGALRELVQGIWRGCRIWLSGRPYAFRTARQEMEKMTGKLAWQFFRVGQLDEPECRFLLETAKPPSQT